MITYRRQVLKRVLNSGQTWQPRAYNRGLSWNPPSGVQRHQRPRSRVRGKAPLKLKTFSCWMPNGSSKFASFSANWEVQLEEWLIWV